MKYSFIVACVYDQYIPCFCYLDSTTLILFCFQIEPLFASTVLRGNQEWIEQLEKWLPSDVQEKTLKLCYRASVNGWASSTFHSFCDNKGPTVVLVKSGQYVFGGYAAAQWGGKSLSFKTAPFYLFLFKLFL